MEEKPWYKSKGVIGGLTAVVAAVLGGFSIDVSAANQEAFTNIVLSIIGTVGGIVGIVGRVKADTKIAKAKKD